MYFTLFFDLILQQMDWKEIHDFCNTYNGMCNFFACIYPHL